MTRHRFCDFVVLTNIELHIERIMLDETLIKSALPIAEKFYKLCILPELLGKWYTRKQPPSDPTLQTEEDDGSCVTAKSIRVGTWFAVIISPAQQHGSTLSVLDCLLCLVANGSAQNAIRTRTVQEKEKGLHKLN